jgi:hypothetical protein
MQESLYTCGNYGVGVISETETETEANTFFNLTFTDGLLVSKPLVDITQASNLKYISKVKCRRSVV